MDDLHEIALSSLQANIKVLKNKKYLLAGAHQFHTLWTRDFAFSVPGLLCVGETQVVRDHLDYLLTHRNAQHLVPRVVDSVFVPFRVLLACSLGVRWPLSSDLKPQYHDEHGSKAVDSNLLTILAAFSYGEHDPQWLKSNFPALRECLAYYENFQDADGLLVQPAFSDWQDSARRTGKTSYTNFLYWTVLKKLSDPRQNQVKESFRKAFLNNHSGLASSFPQSHHHSLETQLFLLLSDFLSGTEKHVLYQNLQKSPLWSGIASTPNYKTNELSLAVRLALNPNYHGDRVWTWLLALLALTAKKMNDENSYLLKLSELRKHMSLHHTVSEILDCKTLLPVRTLVYKSEQPFSWGAAMILWAINENKNINFL